MNVFISHASADDRFVERLAARLDRTGIDVWHDARNLRAGHQFGQEIQRAIDNADAVLIVYSQAAARSDWVTGEFEYARNAGKKLIVLWKQNQPINLPPALAAYTALDFSNARKFDAGLADLLAALIPSAPPPVPVRRLPEPRLLLFALVAVVLAVVLVFGLLNRGDDDDGGEDSDQATGSTAVADTASTMTQPPTIQPTPPPLTATPTLTPTTPGSPAPDASATPAPSATAQPIPGEVVTLLLLYPSTTYMAIAMPQDAPGPVDLTAMAFKAAARDGTPRALVIAEFVNAETIARQMQPGQCLVFFDGLAPDQVPNCTITATYRFALNDPRHEKVWLAENTAFMVMRGDETVTLCPTNGAVSCSVDW